MSCDEEEIDPAFGAALGELGPALLTSLDALEKTFRRLHPPDIEELRPRLMPVRESLDRALKAFVDLDPLDALAGFCDELIAASEFAQSALVGLAERPAPAETMTRTLRSMHEFARSQARLYPLRHALPPVSAFFAEPFRRSDLAALEATPENNARTGLFRGGAPDAGSTPEEGGLRGGFDLYVPESWDGREALPLVVALHGGAGNGGDFLWTWLREARSRRCLLLAPTSHGSTWSLNAPEIDGRSLREMVAWISQKWCVDLDRVLLTGLSDGATMTLLVGLSEENPFTHLAPISGVLHPLNFAIGNIERARDQPIELVHGALDWMFPVGLAREAAEVLSDAGAVIRYHEIDDLSHTYPREMNARLITWFTGRDSPGG